MKHIKVEVCAGSVQDCLIAQEIGADQIELNSAVYMGGLTPSLATVKLAKSKVSIPIYPMLRPRGGGFHYSALEVETMLLDAHLFAKEKVEGLVFGFLNEDRSIDVQNTLKFVNICQEYNIDAIFHRAFDNVVDPFIAIETLIQCGVNRVLTSGLAEKSYEGMSLLKKLQEQYGNQIEIIVGSGINKKNVLEIVNTTGVNQVHASFKSWEKDPTTQGQFVSYAYSNEGSYDIVGETVLKDFLTVLKKDSK